MPDFTLCSTADCPRADECLRFRAVEREDGQSWVRSFSAHSNESNCTLFLKLSKNVPILTPDEARERFLS